MVKKIMIAIYNLEPKYKNLALEKVRKYYTDNGEEVEEYYPINYGQYDKVYCSSIFTFTPKSYVIPDDGIMICGGSGFDLKTKLPPEIEKVKPRLNFGFTTRGCIRDCPFCIVPQKEGKIKVEGDIYDIWDGKGKKIILYDNNILAIPKHFGLICSQIKKENLTVDFNQGLDIRLITNVNAKILTNTQQEVIRFAWDSIEYEKEFKQGMDIVLKYIPPYKIMIYLLCGYDSTFGEDMYRLKEIRKMGCNAFVMLYHKKSKLLNDFARWNNRFCLRNCSFETYLKRRNTCSYFIGFEGDKIK